MAVPRYIFDIISYLDDDEDNLPQIIEKFKLELQEDGKLNAFESYLNIMTCKEVAGLLRIAYSIPESVKIEEPSEDKNPTVKYLHKSYDYVTKKTKEKAAAKKKQMEDQ